MRYVTETRGGWNEWGDAYEGIVGVIIDGDEYPIITEDVFTDTFGNPLKVEFPMRKNRSHPISVERYEPSYDVWEARSLSDLEAATDEAAKTIDVSQLDDFHFAR